MDDRHWIETFQARLREQGLPSRYVRRAVRELGEHLLDVREHELMDELRTSAAEHMGNADEVAQAMAADHRRRGFFRRRIGYCLGAATGLAASAIFVGGFLAPSALGAADRYLAEVRVERAGGPMVAAPQMLVAGGTEASCRFQDGEVEYLLKLRAAGDSDQANHIAELTVSTTDERGKKHILAMPRLALPSNEEGRVETDAFRFRLVVRPTPCDD